MTYLFEVTADCAHGKSSPLNVAGSAFDVKSLKFTCSQCGKPANVNYAEEVGLDPSNPDFEKRIQEMTSGFSSQSFYIGTVKDGQLRLEARMREQIRIDFRIYCKTCQKLITVDEKLKETVRVEHKDHDVQVSPMGDVELKGHPRKLFRKFVEDLFGEPVQFEDEKK